MENQEKSQEEKVIIQFNKIKLLNDIANSIANYGEQCGYSNLFEQVDLNCGAIPEGNIREVIDFSSPEQFLYLYTHIAESRLAFAVTQVLKISDKCWQPILDFCRRVGQDNQVQGVNSVENALYIYQLFILDGMPDEKNFEITVQNENEISWIKLKDTHETFWEKYKGDINNYYQIIQAFIGGLLENSGIKFFIKDNKEFTLKS